MKTPEELKKIFQNWKSKKDSKLLKLYQEKSSKESKGEDSSQISEKISSIEQEISQKHAKLEKDLGRIYAQMYKAGASSAAKKARQERTHHLCNLGGLVEKAGLGEMEPSALLGMLLQQADFLSKNPGVLSRWTEMGQAVLSEREE
mgnify:FL=1